MVHDLLKPALSKLDKTAPTILNVCINLIVTFKTALDYK